MKRYPRSRIPFPVRPKDTVYLVIEGEGTPEVVAECAQGVGIDEDGMLFVHRNDEFERFGVEGRCFFTEEDAQAYLADPTSIPEDYGWLDLQELDLPRYPGTQTFFPDYDPVFDRWDLFISRCTHILFNDDGTVDSYDEDGSSDRIVGERRIPFIVPTFDTIRKARNYCRKQGHGDIRW